MVALLVSPHLDDAVFACGEWLAASPGTVVCTMFAATPGSRLHTDWDRQCGFADSSEAMEARLRENSIALSLLNATSCELPFLDSQYNAPASEETLFCAVLETVEKYLVDALIMPLGLFHSDHELTHRACLKVLRLGKKLRYYAYEDALYRQMGGLVQARLGELRAVGISATPAFPQQARPLSRGRSSASKRAAVGAYQSQLRAFGPGGYRDVFAPERYWALSSDSMDRAR